MSAKKQTTLNFKATSATAPPPSVTGPQNMDISKKTPIAATIPMDAAHKLYMESMTERELRAYKIAKEHLGHSFHIEKSVGYKEHLKAAAAAAATSAAASN